MVRRTRSKRTRPKRDTGQGIGAPSRGNKSDPWAGVSKRVDVSYEVLGHPQQVSKPAEEGKHYTVLAYTDWADQFIPTVIKWNHGAVDDLKDKDRSEMNRLKAVAYTNAKKYGSIFDIDPEKETDKVNQSIKPGKTHYKCPDCGHEQTTGAARVRCSQCKSLNLLRELPSGGYIKADMSEKPQVKYLFDRNGTPYYGIWDPVKDKYLHEDGTWTDPYPEKGLMYYANNEDIAGLKLRTITSETGQQVKPKTYVVELYSSKDDGVYEVEVQAGSLADAEDKGREILSKKYPRHGSDVVAYEKKEDTKESSGMSQTISQDFMNSTVIPELNAANINYYGKSDQELVELWRKSKNPRESSGMSQTIKPAKAQIKIGGKWFVEHTGAYTAKEAREKAADIRKRGYNARVIKTGSGYTVYAAKKEA